MASELLPLLKIYIYKNFLQQLLNAQYRDFRIGFEHHRQNSKENWNDERKLLILCNIYQSQGVVWISYCSKLYVNIEVNRVSRVCFILLQTIYIGPQEIYVLKVFTYCRFTQEIIHLNDTRGRIYMCPS